MPLGVSDGSCDAAKAIEVDHYGEGREASSHKALPEAMTLRL